MRDQSGVSFFSHVQQAIQTVYSTDFLALSHSHPQRDQHKTVGHRPRLTDELCAILLQDVRHEISKVAGGVCVYPMNLLTAEDIDTFINLETRHFVGLG
ncbi:hypothetical protein ElyMa_001905100 [Elysia marginata]|uniref:Uncharacterized protein n=1 Tax=Elysia marginata TaxID=1093978 RepID=A0AAV4ET03_9GAST|nr:hypothetical protein ElyMa_001905100 [Elysia marginata]